MSSGALARQNLGESTRLRRNHTKGKLATIDLALSAAPVSRNSHPKSTTWDPRLDFSLPSDPASIKIRSRRRSKAADIGECRPLATVWVLRKRHQINCNRCIEFSRRIHEVD